MKALNFSLVLAILSLSTMASATLIEDGSAFVGEYVNVSCKNNVGDGFGSVLGTSKHVWITAGPGELDVFAHVTKEEIDLDPAEVNFVFKVPDGFQNATLIDQVKGAYASPTRILETPGFNFNGDKQFSEYSLDTRTGVLSVLRHDVIFQGSDQVKACVYKKIK